MTFAVNGTSRKFCVIDTERIKGNLIYLLSYQLYGEDYELLESVTIQDTSIDLSSRKSPRRKTKGLQDKVIKVSSFHDMYNLLAEVMDGLLVIVFSCTDVNVIKRKCRNEGENYKKIQVLDLQKVLFDLATDEKRKSNLKSYCKKNGIPHEPHIPESDCQATFALYRNLLKDYGEDFLENYKALI